MKKPARAGFFIRTRADAGLNVAAPGQPARRDAALASGAHILSTDFPAGEPHAELGYVVNQSARALALEPAWVPALALEPERVQEPERAPVP